MAERTDIFQKRRLRPGQFRAVAELRFGDAECLLKSVDQKRANGAIYLGGFVIECLLKAMLLDRHPNLQIPLDPAKLSEPDKRTYQLLYNHALDEMLTDLPEIQKRFQAMSNERLWKQLQSLCSEWTIFVRYSPVRADLQSAKRFLETVDEVKLWLSQM